MGMVTQPAQIEAAPVAILGHAASLHTATEPESELLTTPELLLASTSLGQ